MNNLSSEIAIKTDRLSVVESNIKERNSFLEILKEENAAHKEKLNSIDHLIEQLQKLVDRIDINEIAMKDKIKEEVERIKGFQKAMFDIKEKIDVKDVDVRNYVKHILRTGKESEKREIIGCFKSKILLKNKKISLE